MVTWAIWYEDGSCISGTTKEEWQTAPSTGVQVVVEYRLPGIHERPWAGVFDRLLWTGIDEYDPWGWGIKYGSLIDDNIYQAIWEQAAHG